MKSHAEPNGHPGADRRLSLALVTETWRPEVNGVAMTLGRLVDGLRARHHQVEVVRPRQDGDAGGDLHGAHLLRASLPIPRYTGLRLGLPSSHVLRARWRTKRPDLVHVATEGPLGLSALRAAHSLGIPVSSGFHTNFHDYSGHYGIGVLRSTVEGYLRWFHNRTRCTLVPTEVQRNALARAGFRGVRTLGRGVDAELFHPRCRSAVLRAQWGAGEDTLVAVLVSRSAPEKNIPLAIRAFRALRAVVPDAVMVIAGDGPERARLAAANPDIYFIGNLPRPEIAAIYASADLFLFPSMSETFGNVVLEAMASGVPAVAFAYAAPEMYMRDGVNGRLVPFGDADAFIAASVEAARNRGHLRAMAAAARATAATVSWDAIVNRLESLFASAITIREPQP